MLLPLCALLINFCMVFALRHCVPLIIKFDVNGLIVGVHGVYVHKQEYFFRKGAYSFFQGLALIIIVTESLWYVYVSE